MLFRSDANIVVLVCYATVSYRFPQSLDQLQQILWPVEGWVNAAASENVIYFPPVFLVFAGDDHRCCPDLVVAYLSLTGLPSDDVEGGLGVGLG